MLCCAELFAMFEAHGFASGLAALPGPARGRIHVEARPGGAVEAGDSTSSSSSNHVHLRIADSPWDYDKFLKKFERTKMKKVGATTT